MKHSKADKSKKEHASQDADKTSAATNANNAVVEKKDKVFAITSLVCGLLFWVPLFNFVLGPLAVIFGILAINRVRVNPERYSGQIMAIVGLIFGVISVIFTALYVYAALFRPDLLVTGFNTTLVNNTFLK